MRKIITTLVIGWLMVFLIHWEAFSSWENFFTDKITALKARPVDPRIKILAIDKTSVDKIGDPWSKKKMAVLLEQLASGGAKAVWPDILYTEKSADPEEDKALAEVISKHDNVFLPVHFDFTVLKKSQEEIKRGYLKLPVVKIPKERLGHVNILEDQDGIVRRLILGIPTLEGEIMPLIDVRLANLLLPEDGKITWNQDYVWQRGEEEIPIDERLQVGFSYASSPAMPSFDVVPAWQVMQGQVAPSYFKDALVLIGSYGMGVKEQYTTPMSGSKMAEVEIHANIIQALLDKALFAKVSKSKAIMIVVPCAMLAYLLFEWARTRLGAGILLALIIGYSVLVYYVFSSQSLLLPYLYTLFAFVLAFAVALASRYILAKRGQVDQN